MNNTHAPSTKEHNKDTKFRSQMQTIFHYLSEHVATASMVSDATGIPQTKAPKSNQLKLF